MFFIDNSLQALKLFGVGVANVYALGSFRVVMSALISRRVSPKTGAEVLPNISRLLMFCSTLPFWNLFVKGGMKRFFSQKRTVKTT